MRFYYMVVIITGVLLLINMAGIITPTGSLIREVGLVGNNGQLTYSNFTSSSSFVGDLNDPTKSSKSSLAFILGGLAIAGIAATLFGRSPDIRWVTAGFILMVTGILLGDLSWLFIYVQKLGVEWVTNILSLLIGVMMVGLVITAIQFWIGSD